MRFRSNDVPIPLNLMKSVTMIVQSTEVNKDWNGSSKVDLKLFLIASEDKYPPV